MISPKTIMSVLSSLPVLWRSSCRKLQPESAKTINLNRNAYLLQIGDPEMDVPCEIALEKLRHGQMAMRNGYTGVSTMRYLKSRSKFRQSD